MNGVTLLCIGFAAGVLVQAAYSIRVIGRLRGKGSPSCEHAHTRHVSESEYEAWRDDPAPSGGVTLCEDCYEEWPVVKENTDV